jgi:WD40 repeat protein
MNRNGIVKLAALYTGLSINEYTGLNGDGADIAISPDGQILAGAGAGKRVVKLWDVSTTGLIQTIETQTKWLRSIVFGPEGELFISGAYIGNGAYNIGNGKIEVWGKTKADLVGPVSS